MTSHALRCSVTWVLSGEILPRAETYAQFTPWVVMHCHLRPDTANVSFVIVSTSPKADYLAARTTWPVLACPWKSARVPSTGYRTQGNHL